MKISPQLIKDCQKGDRKAQFQLYRTCFNRLMGICMRYKQDEAAAAAALNGGFLKVLNSLDKYRLEVPFEAWIGRIMINTLVDEFRKDRKVRELIEYKDFSQEDPSTDGIDFNLADQQFDAEQLEEMIKRLPNVSQKVFNLFAIDGYSHQEIADLLNISTGTSKWHLSSGRKKIQEMINKALNASKIS